MTGEEGGEGGEGGEGENCHPLITSLLNEGAVIKILTNIILEMGDQKNNRAKYDLQN